MGCPCCPKPGWTAAQIIEFQGIEVPYVPTLPPVPGVTFEPVPLREMTPSSGPLPDVLKYDAQTAYWWATLARASYLGQDAVMRKTLGAWFTPKNLAFRSNDQSFTPGITIAEYDGGMLVVVSGTTNEYQRNRYIISHAATLHAGPGWSINETWYNAGAALAPLVRERMPRADFPVFCIGHSYGAAVASVILSLLPPSGGFDGRQLVSFGSMAFGNHDYCNLAANRRHLRFANEGDFVPFLPPPSLFSAAIPGVSGGFRINGGAYYHCVAPTRIYPDGTFASLAVNEQDTTDWFGGLTNYLNGVFTTGDAHDIRVYVSRLEAAQAAQSRLFRNDWQNYDDIADANADMERLRM